MKRTISYFTDSLLCHNIKKAFAKAEERYGLNKRKEQLLRELERFEEDPLRCAILDNGSSFEKTVKMQMKLYLGFLFVFLPLLAFLYGSYLFGISYSYAFLATFILAILVSKRVEYLTQRYINLRKLEFLHR